MWFLTSLGATFLLKSRKEWAKLILMYLCNLIHSCSVTQSCPTLCNLMGCSMPGFFVLRRLLEFAEIHVESVMPSNHLILCHPLILLPSVFWVSSSESALRIRWPKYRSFSFSISLSNEYSGLISFRIDWFDLLAIQGTLKSLLQHHNLKGISS